MTKRSSTIPVHKLQEHTDQRYHLKRVNVPSELDKKAARMDDHRDDHYIFLLLEKGWGRMMVDFNMQVLKENTAIFVLPGQVHNYKGSSPDATGWFLALDAGLIPDLYRAVLEDPLLMAKPLVMSDAELQPLVQCLQLVSAVEQQRESVYARQSLYSLLASFVGIVADLYAGRCGVAEGKLSRPKVITLEFRQMVAQRFKTLKSPGEYAEALHLSLSYLNEIVKETTGFTVSYWIQQEIILEAKRLLYYSQCSVKEIAHELGYEDHTYFSRLFKKQVGQTPGEFRGEYRGLASGAASDARVERIG
ncbi:MAG TPA: helix-turn-helix transcriptional regulator [Puia sp.]|jgi:AraC-like DNA-binding protein|nr:helix-turn-helix transcriptional regulator [Puia sp.]